MEKFNIKEKISKIFKRDKVKEQEYSKAVANAMVLFNKYSLLFEGLLAMVINFIIEWCSRHSFMEAFGYLVHSPITFMYNSFLIFITFSVVYLFRRRFVLRILISMAWISLGVVNGYILADRVTPFTATDLTMMDEAMDLISTYFTLGEFIFLASSIILVIGIIVYFIYSNRNKKNPCTVKMRRMYALIACGGWLALFLGVTHVAINTGIVSNYFGNIAFAYRDYGVPYCFMSSVFDTGMQKPFTYSEENILNITEGGATPTVHVNESEENPNIIFVQLESFFDPMDVEFLKTQEDAIPYFRELMENYSTGYLNVPSLGAGTANVEFEVLTGMNMKYFGPGEIPYKTIMSEQTSESLATALSNVGYEAFALHNNGGNFYSRSIVFDNMGFDHYTSEEFMNIDAFNEQGWAGDDILIEHVQDALDSTEATDFIMAITVEGHGPYPTDKMENPAINVIPMEDTDKSNSWEYYVNLLHESDKFVQGLIEMIEQRDEPTVVVFYGDHLPTLGLEADDLTTNDLYKTNYVIWDNIGLDKKDQDLTTYQIAAEVFNQLDIETGTMFQYHQQYINSENYMQGLELLQYDLLYGDKYAYQGQEIIASEGHMEMGINDSILTHVVELADGSIGFIGEDFTPWSEVFVNGKAYKTKYVSDTRVDVVKLELEEGDKIVINHVASSYNTIFRSSATYEYYLEGLVATDSVLNH